MQQVKTSLVVLMGLLLLPGCASIQNEATTGFLQNKVPGTATLTGKVTAPKAFEAAKVYAQNMDKNIIYMVYTGDGNYQAVPCSVPFSRNRPMRRYFSYRAASSSSTG